MFGGLEVKMKLTKSKIVMIGAAALGLIAVFMLFLAGIKTEIGKQSATESCFNVMFGNMEGKELKVYQFNFMAFLPFLLMLGGIALCVVSLFVDSKILKFIALGLFVVAAVFMFCYVQFFPMSYKDEAAKKLTEAAIDNGNVKLGIGAILVGILNILAAAATAVSLFAVKD